MAKNQPIAIVGLGCRLPGRANTPEALWQNMLDRVDAVTEIPAERWDADSHFHHDGKAVRMAYSKWGGFIDEIDQFEPEVFGITPREAHQIDPQQRILMEASLNCIRDAGYAPADLDGKHVGVFVGVSTFDYANKSTHARSLDDLDTYAATGTSLSITANRLSYVFNLRGPSFAIDTACSSSLLATHLASQSIWRGESRMALVGGVNAMLEPNNLIAFSKMGLLSPLGRCKAFSEEGLGFVRSEGSGVVMLKLLADAQRDGDHIYALIRATGANQDGRTNGIALPNQSAQEELYKKVYKQAGIDPARVGYVEAHGTGTVVGDFAEANSLGNVLGLAEGRKKKLLIGSIKTNIGHLEAGSGIAGLIKATLSLHHEQVPPNLHFEKPNPRIKFRNLKLKVVEKSTSLRSVQYAGVNSFGFGGANVHVVLEKAPTQTKPRARRNESLLLPLSVDQVERAPVLLTSFRDFLQDSKATTGEVAAACMDQLPTEQVRINIVGRSKDEWLDAIGEYLDAGSSKNVLITPDNRRAGRLAFVFSGQGPQWFAMGKVLYENHARFRYWINKCNRLVQRHASWSVVEEIYRGEDDSQINDTALAQPIICVFQIALARIFMELGIEPEGVVGHSIGEIAAAHIAGALDLATAIKIIVHRGKTMGEHSLGGRMVAVSLPQNDLYKITEATSGEVLNLAAFNAPADFTLAGTESAIDRAIEICKQENYFHRKLRVEHAFHSALMEPVHDPLIEAIGDIKVRVPDKVMVSSVTTDVVSEKLDAEYWWENVRRPVRFAPAVSKLIDEGFETFVEIAPHPVLLASLLKIFAGTEKENLSAAPTIYRKSDELVDFWRAVATLQSLHHDLDLSEVLQVQSRKLMLPGFPFLKTTYWCESYENRVARLTPIKNYLLGKRVVNHNDTFFNYLELERFPFLGDHQVRGAPLFPATGYIETFLAFVQCHLGQAVPYRLENFQFEKALTLKGEGAYAQTMVEHDDRTHEIRFFSRLRGEHDSWTLHCKAVVPQTMSRSAKETLDLDSVIERLGESIPGAHFYHGVSMSQIYFGPKFRGIRTIWTKNGEILTEIKAPKELNIRDYVFHPALLDMTLQSSSTNRPPYLDTEIARYTLVPVRIASFTMYSTSVTPQLYVHIVKQRDTLRSALFDSKIYNDRRELLAEFSQVELYGIEALSVDDGLSFDDWVYYSDWHSFETTKPGHLQRLPTDESSFNRMANAAARSLISTKLERLNGTLSNGLCDAFINCTYPRPEARQKLERVSLEKLVRKFPQRYEDILKVYNGHRDSSSDLRIHQIDLIDGPSAEIVDAARRQADQLEAGAKILEVLYHRTDPVLFCLQPHLPSNMEYHVVVESREKWQKARRERQVSGQVKVHVLEPKHLMRKSAKFDTKDFDLILLSQAGFIENFGSLPRFTSSLSRLLVPGGRIIHEHLDRIPFWKVFRLDARDEFWQGATPSYNGHHEVLPKTGMLSWHDRLDSVQSGLATKVGSTVDVLQKPIRKKVGTAKEAQSIDCYVEAKIFDRKSGTRLKQDLEAALSAEGIAVSEKDREPSKVLHLVVLNSRVSAQHFRSTATLDVQHNRWFDQLGFLRSHLNELNHETSETMVATWGSSPLDEQDDGFSLKSSIWPGVIRSLQQEYPQVRIRHIQLDSSLSEPDGLKHIVAEVLAPDGESYVAYRKGKRHVYRLRKGSLFYPAPILKAARRPVDDTRYRLQLGQGNSIDSIGFYEQEKIVLDAHEVEILVQAAALNFRDVLKVLGLYPADSDDYLNLGDECAGVVSRIGSAVKNYKVGDEVFAIGQSSFASHATTHEDLVFAKPKKLSFEQASTIPVVFLTAYYSLLEVARLEKGETVLIHAAAGGVGLAAIQIAQRKGAHIIATASMAKQPLLRGLGLQHVFNSRDVSFFDDVMDVTGGRGVDVVLNSLAGEAQEKSMELLAPFGRFVEIGKKDIYMDRNTGLYKFRENASFHVVDLSTLIKSRSPVLRRLVERTMAGFTGRNAFYPICHTVFGVAEVKEALRYMGKGSHIGKIVIDMRSKPVDIWPKVGKWQKPHPNATYVVVGGAKGFGVGFTTFLALNGARNLVLFGRSKVPKVVLKQLKEAVDQDGTVNLVPMEVDVTDSSSVKSAFAKIRKTLPPVRGVVHTAGVYEDQLVNDITVESFRKVCSPKTLGVWNLHQATKGMKLDFFTMTSSIASLLGNAGQVSYAAANSFLDAFAYYRRSLGLPASTINFGPIKGVGIIARNEMLEGRMARFGIDMLPPHLGIQLTEFALNNKLSNVAAFRINFRDWLKGVPEDRVPSYLQDLYDQSEDVDELDGHKEKILGRVLALDHNEAVDFVLDYIKQVTSKIIGVDPDTIAGQDNFQNIGLDSLMAVEMQHKIESTLDIKLSAGEVAKNPTVQGLVDLVISKVRIDS